MTVEQPISRQKKQRVRLLKDIVIGGICVPLSLVGIGGILAYLMYLLF
jgi:hypothetical protein